MNSLLLLLLLPGLLKQISRLILEAVSIDLYWCLLTSIQANFPARQLPKISPPTAGHCRYHPDYQPDDDDNPTDPTMTSTAMTTITVIATIAARF